MSSRPEFNIFDISWKFDQKLPEYLSDLVKSDTLP